MTKYGKYLRKVQEKYFENIIKTAYPSAKYKVIETYWENDINLPFHIFGEIKIKRKSYNAILEFFRYKVKEYDTNYGILVLALYNQKNNNDNLYVYINPVTLECNICFDGTDKEQFRQSNDCLFLYLSDCLFLYLKGGEKNARQGNEHNSWSNILCSHV